MNYYNPLLQQMQPIQMPQNNIVNVPSEDMARNYPVAPGNTIIFKHDNAPYIYTKTIGYSQFDTPVFERYVLDVGTPKIEPVKDEPISLPLDDIKAEISEIRTLYEELKDKIDKPKRTVKKEVENDE